MTVLVVPKDNTNVNVQILNILKIFLPSFNNRFINNTLEKISNIHRCEYHQDNLHIHIYL